MLNQSLLNRDRLASIQNVAVGIREDIAAAAILYAIQFVKSKGSAVLRRRTDFADIHIENPSLPG